MNRQDIRRAGLVVSATLVCAGCGGVDVARPDASVGRADAASTDAFVSISEDARGSEDGAVPLDAAAVDALALDAAGLDAFVALERDGGVAEPDAALVAGDAGAALEGEAAWRVVTTFAGSGARGSSDGPAASASFSDPTGLAFDGSGDLLVLDRGSGRVRRVSPEGMVRTVALTGTLRGPYAIVVASDGSWLVSDSDDSCIRRIVDGAVSSYAGVCGARGTAAGDASTARFDRPRQLALDDEGTLWVVDGNNHTLRRVAADGSVTTHAGLATVSGFADADRPGALYYPWGVAPIAGGLLVAGQDSCVRRVTDTRVERLAGQCGNFGNTGFVDGDGASARFDWIKGLAPARWGTVYVADTGNDAIRALDADGTTRTITGSSSGWMDGALEAAQFRGPTGLVVGPDDALYVADTDNQRIRRIAPP
jgi:DNA-binding beta-propeller fold protein YncE